MIERASWKDLRRRCDASSLGITSTDELEPIGHVVGQDRAVRAIQFGVQMRRKGYNVFALGPTGSGRHTVVKDILQTRAKDEPVPPDYVYVNNFADPRRPNALRLPPGKGRAIAAPSRLGTLPLFLAAAYTSLATSPVRRAARRVRSPGDSSLHPRTYAHRGAGVS